MICLTCWARAYVRARTDTSKTQTEHYHDLIAEDDGGPLVLTNHGWVHRSCLNEEADRKRDEKKDAEAERRAALRAIAGEKEEA